MYNYVLSSAVSKMFEIYKEIEIFKIIIILLKIL